MTLDTASVSASDSSDTTDTSDTGDDTTTGPEGPHPELYPYDRVHSPITAYVADRMRAIAPQPDTIDTTFVKAGGTTTASPNFMHCLSDDLAIVGMPPELIDTRDFFNLDIGAGITSFTRDSLAAMTAWPSFAVASALLDELDALHPRFAHVLVGTHDLADEQHPWMRWRAGLSGSSWGLADMGLLELVVRNWTAMTKTKQSRCFY